MFDPYWSDWGVSTAALWYLHLDQHHLTQTQGQQQIYTLEDKGTDTYWIYFKYPACSCYLCFF